MRSKYINIEILKYFDILNVFPLFSADFRIEFSTLFADFGPNSPLRTLA